MDRHHRKQVSPAPPRNLSACFGLLVAGAWACLLFARGRFWSAGPTLPVETAPPQPFPAVTAILPARDEAEHIAQSLGSLLRQSYPGPLRILLVDDNSTDNTGAIARTLAMEDQRLHVLTGTILPRGWTGKLWAVSQGLAQPEAREADFFLITDADIVHGPGHVTQLVAHATAHAAGLVSEMVTLRTESLAERALVPAFVFFFQLLYPFCWVNNAQRKEAAAAGGTMLVSRDALHRIGYLDAIRDRLIDDVALAQEVKRSGHPIWLGHATQARSLRPYPAFRDVFEMVARTAYVQLDHSPLQLAGTVAGMAALYLAPVGLALQGRGKARALGFLSWGMMALAFQPTLRRYRRSALWGTALPAIAAFYTAATVGSAVRHTQGRGNKWKGRAYS